jgi:hypothetical protein
MILCNLKKLFLFSAKYLSFLLSYLLVITFFSLQVLIAQSQSGCNLPQFGVIQIDPDIEVNGQGQNVDSIEFWKSPDSSETLMFVTAKGNQMVEVWKYPFIGNEQTPLTHSTFNNSQVNGIAVDQENNLLYIAIGEPSSTVSVFSLPDLSFQFNFNQAGMNYQSEPNLTILKLTNGDKNIYVSADFTIDVHNAITGSFISQYTPTQGLETMAADNYYQRIYIPDENNRTGVYVYNPDGTAYTINGSNIFGGGGIFDSDAEGIIIYNCPINNAVDNGDGFIVVSDQISNQTDFEFFDRVTWEHLGTLNIAGVSNTDGIASYPYPLPDYPLGVFAMLNNDASVVLVGWEKIFDEINNVTNVKSEYNLPDNFELFQNYPNPFNPSTTIKFTITPARTKLYAGGDLRFTVLKVYDILGNEIATLVNEYLPAGDYEVEFSTTAGPESSIKHPVSGIYFYQLKSGSFIETKKMLLIE